MAFLGKFDFSKMIGVKIADIDEYGRKVKALVIPMEDNGIQIWNDELQLWFRAFAYREKRGKFSHFLMKYIPMKDIKKLSAKQIETFANNSIGAMMKTGVNENQTEQEEKSDFIKDNL